MTQWTMAWEDDVSLVGTSGAGLCFFTIDGGAKKVGARVLAGRIDVVILCVFAHRVRTATSGFCLSPVLV